MTYVIRAKDGDYWSNLNGWTEYATSASYFDHEGDVEEFVLVDFAEVKPRLVQVSKYFAGRAARRHIMEDYDGDPYGWAMSWLFAICDKITFDSAVFVPDKWGFRPSPLGPSSDDEYKTEVMIDWCDDQLLHVGELLHRYIQLLKKHGKDY